MVQLTTIKKSYAYNSIGMYVYFTSSRYLAIILQCAVNWYFYYTPGQWRINYIFLFIVFFFSRRRECCARITHVFAKRFARSISDFAKRFARSISDFAHAARAMNVTPRNACIRPERKMQKRPPPQWRPTRTSGAVTATHNFWGWVPGGRRDGPSLRELKLFCGKTSKNGPFPKPKLIKID